MSTESVLPSNHFILCGPLLLLPSIVPNIRVFSNETVFHIRWPNYWSFSFSISSSNVYSNWFPLGLTVWSPCSPRDSWESSPTPQFKSINSSVLSFLYSRTWLLENIIALTRRTFVGKVMSLPFNILSRLIMGEGNGSPTPVLLPGKSHGWRGLVGCIQGVTKSRTQLSDFTFTFHFHALEKQMATHSSVLAWRIPGTGEPGGLPSMGLDRVGHDWSDLAAAGWS